MLIPSVIDISAVLLSSDDLREMPFSLYWLGTIQDNRLIEGILLSEGYN